MCQGGSSVERGVKEKRIREKIATLGGEKHIYNILSIHVCKVLPMWGRKSL